MYTVSSLFLVSNSVVHTITHGDGIVFLFMDVVVEVGWEKIFFGSKESQNETREKNGSRVMIHIDLHGGVGCWYSYSVRYPSFSTHFS